MSETIDDVWWTYCLPDVVANLAAYENKNDIKYEWSFVGGDIRDDDDADEIPIDDDTDDVPADATCNELCLCRASVLSTEIAQNRAL